MPDPRFEPDLPFSDSDIREIESVLGRELPEEYRAFVQEYGGSFVGGFINASREFSILTFFAADRDDGVLFNLETHPDLREEGILPFADCELGNLYVLDRDNSVHYVSYYDGKTIARKVSDSFHDFVNGIVVPEDE
jgi:hypothetical protein